MSIHHDIVTHPFTINLIRIKAAQLCRRSDFTRSDGDEMRQEMQLYIWTKTHLFNPTRGNIEGFVTNAINSWVGMELRRRHRLKRHAELHALSLERTTIEQDGDAIMLGEVLQEADLHRRTRARTPDPIGQLELAEAVAHATSTLTPHVREILNHVAEHGVASTARKHDVSRRQINNALTRMRARFEDAGLGAN